MVNMRSIVRHAYLSFSGPFKTIANGVHILNSHYISRRDVSGEVFHELLKKLNKEADFIKIQDGIDLIERKETIQGKLIAFTFDDGFEECYCKISPVLKDFNINAAYFINPGFIDGDAAYQADFVSNVVHANGKKPMTWEMIKELHDDGFVIGNHTFDHVRLVGSNPATLEHQISNSKKRIEEITGDTCSYFAWTYGRLQDIDSAALKLAIDEHQHVFSSDNYHKYYSNSGTVLNRRHAEGDWPASHIKFFLSKKYY